MKYTYEDKVRIVKYILDKVDDNKLGFYPNKIYIADIVIGLAISQDKIEEVLNDIGEKGGLPKCYYVPPEDGYIKIEQ